MNRKKPEGAEDAHLRSRVMQAGGLQKSRYYSRPSRKRLGLSPPFGISPLRASSPFHGWIPHEGLRPCKEIYSALLMQAWQS